MFEKQLTECSLLLCLVLACVASSGNAAVELRVNATTTGDDDYFCWAPVPLEVTLSDADASGSSITISSESLGGTGVIGFHTGVKPTRNNISLSNTILVDPQNGATQVFWVAGTSASTDKKDIAVVARRGSSELARTDVMVRVRKDAESLSRNERNSFLKALAKVHRLSNGGIGSEYIKHYRAHEEAFPLGIHGGPSGIPLFLAWHRAFLLNLERELQSEDPSVSLPYWQFDQPAPAIFSEAFLGRVNGANAVGGFVVEWSNNNPLKDWEMFDGNGAMVRARNADVRGPIPAGRLTQLFSQNSDYRGLNGSLEFRYHNGAHSFIGGWLTSAASPRDPLFFLLHANVDRAWAEWQRDNDRFDDTGTVASDYHATGNYSAIDPNRFRKGSYAQDEMWPWGTLSGDGDLGDPGDNWPKFRYDMPSASSGFMPTPASMVDYLDVDADGDAIGACYKGVPFAAAGGGEEDALASTAVGKPADGR